MRTLLLALLAATGIALLIYSRLDGPAWFGLLGKPLPVIALLLWLRQAPASSYRRWVSIGLVFSCSVISCWNGHRTCSSSASARFSSPTWRISWPTWAARDAWRL